MLAQIARIIIDPIVSLVVALLLLRFHFQWLRVPFRNPVGTFVIAATNWIVMPARRLIPAVAGFDLASLVAAWLVQAAGLVLLQVIAGRLAAGDIGSWSASVALVSAIDLARISVYLLFIATIVQAILSWVSSDSPAAPLLGALTRPFLRPLRRVVPPLSGIDLSPLVLLILLQVLLVPLDYLRELARTMP